ncbi:hypothetical protein HPP92_009288 [Vanilla planifolia]|uniref:Thioredoxin domain-containing protein n=1 Tax=Vanilla planifolia TaxID=51239 RepID=A0A835V7A1_VANPL|nr:hypothetical protein HPP92_009288 [Vanilla planifolia]
MRRFALLLRPILRRPHFMAFTSFQNPTSFNQFRASSPLDRSPSLCPPLYPFFTNSFSLSSHDLFYSSSASPSSPSNIVYIGSEEGFNTALNKAQEEKSPSIFYFTAAWCGPCRLISPVVEQLSKELPHVTTYKLDIDQESLSRTLSKLQIFSVPTIHFFHNGEKASEIVGADVAKLKETSERLYKKV